MGSAIFSDESKLKLHGSGGIWYVRRHKREALHQNCMSHTVKFPLGQMVWGYISSKGIGNLKLVRENENASDYSFIID